MDDNHEKYYCLDTVDDLRPQTLLDVGCGCGELTVRLAPLCGRVTAVDLFERLIERCRSENARSSIEYLPMDARSLQFPDHSFEVVLENNALHHIDNWQTALAEMVRVARSHILIEEPIYDPRTDAKRAAETVQDLMLEVQKEVGYPHYRHLRLNELLAAVRRHPLEMTCEVFLTEELSSWEGFESAMRFFGEKSGRLDYWLKRFADLKTELAGQPLIEADKVLIVASRK